MRNSEISTTLLSELLLYCKFLMPIKFGYRQLFHLIKLLSCRTIKYQQ